mgnify:CR=1 FL=1|jgi:hypothetical protein
MTTYRLFSYRSVAPTPEEIVDTENFYFPWESVSSTPTILTEDRTTTRIELSHKDGETIEESIEYTLRAGEIDPAWFELANCEHTIDLCMLRVNDITEEHMEQEDFDDVDEEGTPFTNQREVAKTVTTDRYIRRYVLCSEYCTSYNLPDRFEARYDDVDNMDDQTLRNIYELSKINIEPLKLGDDSELNTLGLRNIDWDTTVPYVSPDIKRPTPESEPEG